MIFFHEFQLLKIFEFSISESTPQMKIFQDVILNLLPNLKEPNPKYKLKKSFVNPDFLTLIS